MKYRRKTKIILAILILIQFVFSSIDILAADNKVIQNVVKDLQIQQIGPVDKSKTFGISGNWSIEDHSVREGDSFTLDFSDNIDLSRLRGSLPLIGADGSVYAIGKLDKISKKIVFTFTDKVEKEINIHGDFQLQGLLLDIENPDPDKGIEKEKVIISEEDGEEFEREVEFNNGGYDIDGGQIVGPGNPDRELNYDKIGQIHSGFNDTMYWYVYVNGRSESERYDTVIDVSDQLKEGHSIVDFDQDEAEFSITVTDEANNNESGIVVYSKGKIVDKEVFDKYIKDFEYSSKSYSLKFDPSGGGQGVKALRIYYHTKIDEDAEFDQTVFENKVDIGADDGFKTEVPREVDFGAMTGSGYGDGYRDGQVNIHKVDNKGNPIKVEGIQFKVEKHEDYPAPNSMHFNGIYTTDKDGVAKIDRLFAGIYKVTELNTPDGYIVNRDPKLMVVNFSAIEDHEREIEYLKMDIENLNRECSYNNNCEDPYYQNLIRKKEKEIEGANKSIEKLKNRGIEFKFTNIPKEKVEYRVNKIWDIKGEDKDLKALVYLRRTSISYDDLGNIKVDTVDLDHTRREILYSDDSQEIVWRGLDKFNDDGEAYIYTIQEEVSDKYSMKREVDGETVNIINTDETKTESEKVELEVEKKWIGIDNGDLPVDSIEIDILKNGNYYLTENISKENNWKTTIKNLDKYEKVGDELREIEYSLVEAPIYGFISTVSKTNDKFIIENKILEQTAIDIRAKKLWKFNDGREIPKKLIPNLLTLDLLANDQVISSKVFKKNENGEFNLAFKDMPKFDRNGKEIIYSIKERGLNNFEKEISGNQNDGFVLKNVLREESISLDVEKIWKDKNGQEINGDNSLLPKRVGVEVLKDGESYLVGIITQDNNWKLSFDNLPKYNKLGEEIKYSVDEISLGETELDSESYSVEGNGKNRFTITNKLDFTEPSPPEDRETIDINIEKRWDKKEGELELGEIPVEDIVIQVIGDGIVVREDTITSDNDWKLSVKDLAKFNDNREEIFYEIKELNWDRESEVEKDGNDFYITNYLDSDPEEPEDPKEKISIQVTKVWKDEENKPANNIPVDSVTMELYADGILIKDFQVSSENNWKATITDLNKLNEKNEKIKYEIKEKDFSGELVEKAEYDFDLVNIVKEDEAERELKSIEIEKKWKDDKGQDLDLIPVNRVRVEILRNESPYLIVLLDRSNDWKTIVDGLYVSDKEGNEYIYSVKELALESPINIESEIETVKEENKFTIINKIKDFNEVSETIDIDIQKNWLDKSGESIEGIMENYIQVKLLRNGEEHLTGLLSKDKKWKGSFKNLKKYDENGQPYKYSLEEVPVLGYTSKLEGDSDNGYKITNQEIDMEKRDIAVKKKWISSIGEDLIPEDIKINLYKDGEFLRTGRLLKSDNWEGVFTNLDKFRKGEYGERIEIVYSIKEVEMEGYDSLISGDFRKGYEIYNVEESPVIDEDLIDIAVKKIWKGGSESSATIILYADGVEVNRVSLNSNKLEHTFKNLAKFDKGREIEYSIKEMEIEGYRQSITGDKASGYIITNTKIEEPEKPTDPEDPKDPEEPEEPKDPEEPEDPKDPEEPEDPNDKDKEDEEIIIGKDDTNTSGDEDTSVDLESWGKEEDSSYNDILPKTGYGTTILIELVGMFLIILGFKIYRKKNK